MRSSLRSGVSLLCVLLSAAAGASAQDSRPVGRQPDGSILVPTHQTLRPAGKQVEFPGRPTDAVLVDNGRTLVVKNRTGLVLIDTVKGVVAQTLPLPKAGLSFHGIAASADGQQIFVTAAEDALWVAARNQGVATFERPIKLAGPKGRGASAPGGIAVLGADSLAICLSRNNTLALVDLTKREVTAEIPVGVAPYEVVVHDGIAWVANWGGRRVKAGEASDPSSGTAVLVDPVTNVAASGTVSVVDLAARKEIAVIEVGLHPSGLALDAGRKRLYVANANSDTVSIIDTAKRAVVGAIDVKPDARLPYGSSPNALALAPGGQRLFVANGTNDAVAVVDLAPAPKIAGFLPTAWYPGALAFDPKQGVLHVVNVKGVGTLNRASESRGSNSYEALGSVSMISAFDAAALAAGTKVVAETNRHDGLAQALEKPSPDARPVPIPRHHGEPSVFEHVVYIIRENRTYDQVLGDHARGNGNPALCIFGRTITPNAHAIADQFVLLDNFHCGSVLSVDGHAWTDESFVVDYIEKMFGGWSRSYPYDGGDPLAYAPTGFIWDNVLRHGRTFRCYGEMVTASIQPKGGFKEIYDDWLLGQGRFTIRAQTDIDAIRANMCPTYVGFPGTVPDQYRASEFLKELAKFEKEGRMPNLSILLLPNDHTTGTRPGMPTPAASAADNDLALGRIVEGISHSRFWPKTCIFVVEDDPQAGWDHVDAHRTVALVVSPYTRREAVVSTRLTQSSMVKTIELILGLPPMNQFDLLATPMTDCFMATPDLRPYAKLDSNIPLDQLNAALDHLDGSAREDALASLELDLDEVDEADEGVFNRILWHAMKGDSIPYPTAFAGDARLR